MNNTLPDKWQTLINDPLLPPGLVQGAFEYSMARLLVEAGEVTVINHAAGDAPVMLRAADGIEFALSRPDIAPPLEVMVQDHLRRLLDWEAE